MAGKSHPKHQKQGDQQTMPPPMAVLRPFKDRAKLHLIMDAIRAVELTETGAWDDLSSLSSNTYVEDIEAVPEGIFETDTGFKAAATVYVDLNYGDKRDRFSTSDSFPAQVEGHFDPAGKAVVDAVSVDTSSFYE